MTATREQIEQLLATERFRYQRVPLPHGLATPGRDRRPTADLVLPERLEGKSVVDVGCALGYFCFEAERRGATRVVGVELKKNRFKQANLLKDVLGSRVEFQRKDFLAEPLGETFDLVLALNLIHHLPEPFTALRSLAELARERLVIEFPTFADKRFRRYAGIRFPRRYDRLPLVGVSSLRKVDQTFVFTPKAIRRVLIDHTDGTLVDRVQFVRSPMKGRMIALCDKGP